MSAAAVLAVSAACLAYLDGYYSFSRDVRQFLADRRFGKRLGARIGLMGTHVTMYHMFELADQSAEALWFEGRSWTYAECRRVADGLAKVIYARGVQNGDFVAVFMTNSPEMVFVLLALSKIGGIPALINNSLRNETLIHCLVVATAKLVICTPDLTQHLSHALDSTKQLLAVNFGSFDKTDIGAETIAADSLPSSFRLDSPKRSIQETAMLIYTSGTSGKPKAVAIKNFHLILVSTPLEIDVEKPPEKGRQIRIYSCLPLFHATALFTGILYAAGVSGALCLSRKFSATNFSKDLYESRATRMLYVGELCRYLLKAPPSQYDRSHSCVVASGNGLQKDVWEAFQDRFCIEDIREFFRSTEGIAKFDNFSGGKVSVGQCGFTGPVTNYFNQHTYIVRFDSMTEKPYRDPKTGFCVVARAGEPGEAIGRVNDMALYHEYLNNPEANREKLMSDVFKKGDLFQRSGDILVRESSGWVRFLERAGDSYRWQGENVSAGEVREHISRLPGVQDVEVYGAVLENYDGQAGAAAIVLKDGVTEDIFTRDLYSQLRKTGLTKYQIPRLLRFTEAITVHATFKHVKNELKKRSWDPDSQVHSDSLWVLSNGTYKELDRSRWEEIRSGKARL